MLFQVMNILNIQACLDNIKFYLYFSKETLYPEMIVFTFHYFLVYIHHLIWCIFHIFTNGHMILHVYTMLICLHCMEYMKYNKNQTSLVFNKTTVC